MMESYQNPVWTPRSEDTMSTASGNSDTEVDITIPGNRQESRLLRFQNVRKLVTGPSTRKGLIASGAILLVVIGCVTFAGVYSSHGKGTSLPSTTGQDLTIFTDDLEKAQSDQPQPSARSSNMELSQMYKRTVILPDRSKPQSVPTAVEAKPILKQAPEPVTTEKLPAAVPQASALSTTSEATTSDSTTQGRKKKNRNKNRPRKLPSNVHEIPPVSLLLQMKLVTLQQNEKIDTVIKTKQCIDLIDNKQYPKGWKASLSINVNATTAEISEQDNHFVGYSKLKQVAKANAAKKALMKAYPGNLTYTFDDMADDDREKLIEICDQD